MIFPTKQQIAEARKIATAAGVGSLLSIDSDPKTHKSNISGKGYLTAIQYLAPAKVSGYQVCAAASAGCIAGCLHTAGVPFMMQNKNKARIARTRFFFEHREAYKILLIAEIAAFVKKAEKKGLNAAVRLNGTSDIVWETVFPELFGLFPNVQFYDYSKVEKRFRSTWNLPANYDLTFSRSECNEEAALRILAENPNARVAVVFSTARTKPLPTEWNGYTVGDADKDDLRFLDSSRIAGLRAKGKARKDTSGFVVQVVKGSSRLTVA